MNDLATSCIEFKDRIRMPSNLEIDCRNFLKGKGNLENIQVWIFIDTHHRVKFSRCNSCFLSKTFRACRLIVKG